MPVKHKAQIGKVGHKLWPENPQKKPGSRPSSIFSVSAQDENLLRTATANLFEGEPDTIEQQREKAVEAAADLIDVSVGLDGADNKAYGKSNYGRAGTARAYASCGVIYANQTEAKILKQRLRNHIEPEKNLGHSDTPSKKAPSSEPAKAPSAQQNKREPDQQAESKPSDTANCEDCG